ncbi:MAG: homing endonuclease associated repeat-containing protein [bacterium]
MRSVYTFDKLIQMYREKTKELGRIPKAAEINDDPDMPAYITYLRKFGNTDEIIKRAGIDRKYLIQLKLDKLLCSDCKFNPESCGEDIRSCRKDAKLYYKMLEKNLIENL